MIVVSKRRALRFFCGAAIALWLTALLPMAALAGGREARYSAFRARLYSNESVSRLVGLQGALAAELRAQGVPRLILQLLELNPEKIAAKLPEYPQAAKALAALGGDWAGYEPASLDWGFADGDRDAFFAACAAGLRPLEALLGGIGDLVGESGKPGQYETAILPLLEALGCPDIQAPEDFAFAARAQSGLKANDYLARALLRPLFGLTEYAAAHPLQALTENLPSLARAEKAGALQPLFRFELQIFGLRLRVFPCGSLEDLQALLLPALGLRLPPLPWSKLAEASRPGAAWQLAWYALRVKCGKQAAE